MARTEARYKKLESDNDLLDLSRTFVNIDPVESKGSKKANRKLGRLMMGDKFLSKSEIVTEYPQFAKDPKPSPYDVGDIFKEYLETKGDQILNFQMYFSSSSSDFMLDLGNTTLRSPGQTPKKGQK